MKYIKNGLAVTILLLSFGAAAQIEVKNRILDFSMLAPIESASIYVKNTTIGTVSNSDGKFILQIPQEFAKDTLVISSIGYKSYKIPVIEFDNSLDIYLEEDVASLDEIILIAEIRPKTGNDIVLKAIEKLAINLPDSAYIQKGFLRHKERNKVEFKWLIESAITVYDSGFAANSSDYLKINVDQVRKSYDLRDIDSIFNYVAYNNQNAKRSRLKVKDVKRSQLSTAQLEKAIKWNDTRVNGLQNIFQGKLNLLRNSIDAKALFGEDILEKHHFDLDTILVDNDRKIYKIKISESTKLVDLETKGIFNAGYEAKGWLYVYYDNYAIKKIEYELVAASQAQKVRSKRLFDTQVNHKLVMTYIEYQDKMYPNYIYYETPKLVNVGFKTDQKVSDEEKERYNKEERYYYTVQEILFSEIILDKDVIKMKLDGEWDMDIFSSKPYDKAFWKNYNVLLESEEDEKLIQDLSKRASLFID
ncbi:carboxypeptidase-like regulatory domain-containing protein [Psychroserpens burtonensis]|uniref:Carboxypeptidase-like regulatory domain-containing protein n=1 Tax=Psychroserpens burtonensis TaxID=49278 RepID=A0A5C7B5C7_9FLAO|nr:carboxypeptidase-like regulatory domain-containing protein [Psychroserpens burtonensis]TXE15759.1 carboxypeptidase-like regulatory domain-containing protein [Psychroserpens burtonensis]